MGAFIEDLLAGPVGRFLLESPFGWIIMAVVAFVVALILLGVALLSIVLFLAKNASRVIESAAFWSVLALVAFVASLWASWSLGFGRALLVAVAAIGAVGVAKEQAKELVKRRAPQVEDTKEKPGQP